MLNITASDSKNTVTKTTHKAIMRTATAYNCHR